MVLIKYHHIGQIWPAGFEFDTYALEITPLKRHISIFSFVILCLAVMKLCIALLNGQKKCVGCKICPSGTGGHRASVEP